MTDEKAEVNRIVGSDWRNQWRDGSENERRIVHARTSDRRHRTSSPSVRPYFVLSMLLILVCWCMSRCRRSPGSDFLLPPRSWTTLHVAGELLRLLLLLSLLESQRLWNHPQIQNGERFIYISALYNHSGAGGPRMTVLLLESRRWSFHPSSCVDRSAWKVLL